MEQGSSAGPSQEKTTHRRRSVLLVGVALLSGVAVFGCLSPTLPLPPPSRPNVSAPSSDGEVRVRGVVQSRATAYVHNSQTDRIVGQVTDSTGEYDLVISAQVGDRLYVWQAIDTAESPPIEVIVPEEDEVNTIPPPGGMGGADGE